MFKDAVFAVNQHVISKFLSQMSNYTQQKFRLGASGADLCCGACSSPFLPSSPPTLELPVEVQDMWFIIIY